MNRREALSSVALLLGGTIIGAEMFLSGCTNADKKIGTAGLDFSPEDTSFLDEVGETIIPATDHRVPRMLKSEIHAYHCQGLLQ